jgi:hypothetical protein
MIYIFLIIFSFPILLKLARHLYHKHLINCKNEENSGYADFLNNGIIDGGGLDKIYNLQTIYKSGDCNSQKIIATLIGLNIHTNTKESSLTTLGNIVGSTVEAVGTGLSGSVKWR